MGFVLERPLPVTRRTRVVGVAVLVLLLAAGVWAWRATRPDLDPGTGARTAAGVTVLLYTEDWGGEYSAVSGRARLAVLKGGCLGLSSGALLVFPHGSTVVSRAGQVAVRVPSRGGGSALVGPGDEVDVGGAGPGVPVGDFGGHLADHVPARCRGLDAVSGIELTA